MAAFEKNGSVLTVRPDRRLDTATAPALEKEIQQHLDGVTEMIMDLENVIYVSSGGIRVIILMEQILKERGGGIRLLHVKDYIAEVFDMIGLQDLLTAMQN